MRAYSEETELNMKRFYQTLNEKDRRRYAGIEAMKLEHGSISYISEVVGCSRGTIYQGLADFQLPDDALQSSRIRAVGGGRKPIEQTIPNLNESFFAVLEEHTAGEPQNGQILWTNLTQVEIVENLGRDHDIQISTETARKLLKKNDFKKRKAQKRHTLKSVDGRNEQFENIAKLKAEFMESKNPVISMDTKKKEPIGNMFREGTLQTRGEVQTMDHDFPNYAEGVVIPHTLYDMKQNKAFTNLGTSHDTSEFVTDCIELWWIENGEYDYPDADEILILCDGGGSNNSRHFIFKADLQNLSNRLDIRIRIAHYPPYCSKFNPVEHRVFPHMSRASQGVIFTSVEVAKEVFSKAKTKTGLKVVVDTFEKVYETGRRAVESFKDNIQIVFDELLPQWNYVAIPGVPNVQVI